MEDTTEILLNTAETEVISEYVKERLAEDSLETTTGSSKDNLDTNEGENDNAEPLVSSLSPRFPGLGRQLADEGSFCSWCKDTFDGRSSPIGCSNCRRVFHKKCHGGHSCDPPD